jgi:protein ImuA
MMQAIQDPQQDASRWAKWRAAPGQILPPDAFRAGSHELHAAAAADAAAVSALALGIALANRPGPILWCRDSGHGREAGEINPAGLSELGAAPGQVALVRARDASSVLQAGLEGARTPGLCAVIIAIWGEAQTYDLTASRRFALATRESGTPVIILRAGAAPAPSAAHTRWRLRALPSISLAARAPGAPLCELTLLRDRAGREGLRYCLEWNRDERRFAILEPAASRPAAAPLSGAVVPFPPDGQGSQAAWRQAG